MSETTTIAAPVAPRRAFRWRWIGIGFVLLIASLVASLLFAPPAFFFTSLLQKAVHDATGHELTVASSNYRIREIVTVELSGVEFGHPGSKAGTLPFTARKMTALVPLRSILDGKPQVLSLDIDAPVLNLQRAPDGSGNWQSGTTATTASVPLVVPPTKIKNGTFFYSDERTATKMRIDAITASVAADPTYGGAAAKGTLAYNNEPLQFDLAVSDAAAAVAGRATTMALVIDSRVLKARLAGEATLGETPMLAGEIDAKSPSARNLASWLGFADSVPATAGAVSLMGTIDAQSKTRASGSLVLSDAPVTYDLTLASLREALTGKPSAVAGTLAGEGLAADIDGTVTLGSETNYSGAVSAKTPSIGSLAGRLGITNPAIKALGAGSMKGIMEARAGKVAFSETAFDAGGRTGDFTGDIAFSGPRPRIRGNMEISKIDLDALLGRTSPAPQAAALESVAADDGFATTFDVLSAELDALQNASAQNALSLEAAPALPTWNTSPIDLTALRAVDLDLDLSVAVINFGQLPLTNARVSTKLDNGELSAQIVRVTVSGGSGSGTVNLKARGTSHDAALALKLQDADAEPITAELSGRPLLKGKSTVEIATRATGRSAAELISTLDGSARIDMKKGQLRGWDIGEMVAQLWNYKGWGYTPSRNTPVDQLTATYTIKRGTITSAPDLNMRGPTAGLRSVGNVVVPRRLIDQNIDVQNLLFNIVIKGDWTKKLWIGPAFLAGLEPVPGAALEQQSEAQPPAGALPKAIPSDLATSIDRILSDPTASARLTAAQKAFLNALLAGGKSGS